MNEFMCYNPECSCYLQIKKYKCEPGDTVTACACCNELAERV